MADDVYGNQVNIDPQPALNQVQNFVMGAAAVNESVLMERTVQDVTKRYVLANPKAFGTPGGMSDLDAQIQSEYESRLNDVRSNQTPQGNYPLNDYPIVPSAPRRGGTQMQGFSPGGFGGPPTFPGTPARGYDRQELSVYDPQEIIPSIQGEVLDADFGGSMIGDPGDVVGTHYEWMARSRSWLRGMGSRGKEFINGKGAGVGLGLMSLGGGIGDYLHSTESGNYYTPEQLTGMQASSFMPGTGAVIGGLAGGLPGALVGQGIGSMVGGVVQGTEERNQAERQAAERFAAALGTATDSITTWKGQIEQSGAAAQQVYAGIQTLQSTGVLGPNAMRGVESSSIAQQEFYNSNLTTIGGFLSSNPAFTSTRESLAFNGALSPDQYRSVQHAALITGDMDAYAAAGLAAAQSQAALNPDYVARSKENAARAANPLTNTQDAITDIGYRLDKGLSDLLGPPPKDYAGPAGGGLDEFGTVANILRGVLGDNIAPGIQTQNKAIMDKELRAAQAANAARAADDAKTLLNIGENTYESNLAGAQLGGAQGAEAVAVARGGGSREMAAFTARIGSSTNLDISAQTNLQSVYADAAQKDPQNKALYDLLTQQSQEKEQADYLAQAQQAQDVFQTGIGERRGGYSASISNASLAFTRGLIGGGSLSSLRPTFEAQMTGSREDASLLLREADDLSNPLNKTQRLDYRAQAAAERQDVIQQEYQYGQNTLGLANTNLGLDTRRYDLSVDFATRYKSPEQAYESILGRGKFIDANIAGLRKQYETANDFDKPGIRSNILGLEQERQDLPQEAAQSYYAGYGTIYSANVSAASTTASNALRLYGSGTDYRAALDTAAGANKLKQQNDYAASIDPRLGQEGNAIAGAAYKSDLAQATDIASSYAVYQPSPTLARADVEATGALYRMSLGFAEPGVRQDQLTTALGIKRKELAGLNQQEKEDKATGPQLELDKLKFAQQRQDLENETARLEYESTSTYARQLPALTEGGSSFFARLLPSQAQAAAMLERDGRPGAAGRQFGFYAGQTFANLTAHSVDLDAAGSNARDSQPGNLTQQAVGGMATHDVIAAIKSIAPAIAAIIAPQRGRSGAPDPVVQASRNTPGLSGRSWYRDER